MFTAYTILFTHYLVTSSAGFGVEELAFYHLKRYSEVALFHVVAIVCFLPP